jgi:hypothetical protein
MKHNGMMKTKKDLPKLNIKKVNGITTNLAKINRTKLHFLP